MNLMIASKCVVAPVIHISIVCSQGDHVSEEHVQIPRAKILQSSIVVRAEAASLESVQPPVLHPSISQVLHHPLHSQRACFTCWSGWAMLSTGVLKHP